MNPIVISTSQIAIISVKGRDTTKINQTYEDI